MENKKEIIWFWNWDVLRGRKVEKKREWKWDFIKECIYDCNDKNEYFTLTSQNVSICLMSRNIWFWKREMIHPPFTFHLSPFTVHISIEPHPPKKPKTNKTTSIFPFTSPTQKTSPNPNSLSFLPLAHAFLFFPYDLIFSPFPSLQTLFSPSHPLIQF